MNTPADILVYICVNKEQALARMVLHWPSNFFALVICIFPVSSLSNMLFRMPFIFCKGDLVIFLHYLLNDAF